MVYNKTEGGSLIMKNDNASKISYIEKARKTFMFLYEDSYVLHEPQGFINNN